MSMKPQFCIAVRYAKLILFLASVTISGTAHANQCGDISQNLEAMGDSYYDIDYTGKDSDDSISTRQNIVEQSKVFKQLRDRSFESGTGERSQCFGSKDNLRVETSSVELKDINQQDDSSQFDYEPEAGVYMLEIDVNEYKEVERTTHRESISISLNQNTDISTAANGNVLELNTRMRRGTKAGSNFHEITIRATLTDSGVDISKSIYVDGYLAEWVSWSLK